MPLRHWLLLGLTAFINLLIGALGAFTLLIAFNGFSEATGGAILLAYAGLFLLMLIGAGGAVGGRSNSFAHARNGRCGWRGWGWWWWWAWRWRRACW